MRRGTLNGTVTDPSGAVVVGAAVKATNIETGVETTTPTTEAGVYRLPYLPPGTYRLVRVRRPGFKGALRENVALQVAQTLTLDFKLEVGAAAEQVTVSAESPMLETGTAEIGSYVSKKEFDTWPITVGDGRRQIQQFIFTSLPGAVGDTFLGSINGGQGYSHEILIDGIALGTHGPARRVEQRVQPVGGIDQRVQAPDRNGRGAIRRRADGGRELRDQERHERTARQRLLVCAERRAAAEQLEQQRRRRSSGQPNKQHNFGYSVGGPVMLPKIYNGKNRTFFFHNLERTRVRNFTSTAFGTLPVPAFKQGDFQPPLQPRVHQQRGVRHDDAGTDAEGRPVVSAQIYDPKTLAAGGHHVGPRPFPG